MLQVRTLIVEDSAEDAELICLELERADLELDWRRVETKEDYVAALDEPWDLIISDFQMPRFNGLDAFRLFRERGLDIPFIFVSGALGEDRAVEAMRAGARDYLLKGNLARLNVAVRRELAEARNRAAQRQAEEARRRMQTRLAMAVEASGAGVFEHSMRPDGATYVSARWAEILGYTTEDLPDGSTLLDWTIKQVHPEDVADFQGAYRDFVEGRAERFSTELRMRHRNGHFVDVACFAKVVEREPDRRAKHVVGVQLDVSERKKLEAQLQQAQKMEAIGRLAGGVAHDFNNLLTAIFSFGSFVLDELKEGDPVHADMREVMKAAEKAQALTSQLLAFSRHKPVSPKVLNIATVIGDMDRMLRRVVGEDVDIATRLSDDLWNVRIDPGSLEQVIVNLAVNARDAMPRGGKLTIDAENTLDAGHGEVRGMTVPPGDYVLVAISDSGVGMDDATKQRIFEPFFTTKCVGQGTGLGLSTCYGIVKQAGGHISVYSEPGVGTTFKVYLPRVVEGVDVKKNVPVPPRLGGTETVIVVEDDTQVRRLVVRSLSRLGYRLMEAANGGEALLKCESSPHPIDLLLTDVVMPEMNGKQLAERLKVLHPRMKVLYMSGYTENAISHRGVLEDGFAFVQKPFKPHELARTVREVLDE